MQEKILKEYIGIQKDTVSHIKTLLDDINITRNKELEAEIELLKKELKEVKKLKKYWLVWEEKQEFFDKQTIWKLPVLKEVNENDVINDDWESNILIEWDNYHTLSVLNYTHKWKIDVIYIDPPYNTWNKSWRYNNDYVEKEDNFRHSKWISFMNKRLKLARNLLKENWCLVCAIDENEHANLVLLLKEVFPEYNVDSVTVIHNPRWVQWKNFSFSHEYAIFVYPNDWYKHINDSTRDEVLRRNFRVDWWNSPRSTSKTMFYPFYIKDNKIIWFWEIPDDDFHPKKQTLKNKDVYEVWPIDVNWIERKWSFSNNTVEWIIESLEVKKTSDRYEIFRLKNKSPYKTVWYGSKYDANEYWSKIVNSTLDTNFPFPKSLYTVKECLNATLKDKNAVVLDFFAGSWTTGHAVLELNKEDWWNRKFILATNNENNICKEVTYERVKRVINWYKNSKWENVEWLWWNLKYLRTDFIDKHKSNDDLRERMVNRCTELLCLKENIWEEVKQKNDKIKLFKRNDKYLAVLYDMFYFDEFKKVLSKLDKQVSIYAFSHYKLLKEDFEDIKIPFEIEDIPDPILEVYDTIFWL